MNWTTIKREYVQGDIGYRPLAEKHKVSFNTLKGRAKRENWYAEREKYRLSVGFAAAAGPTGEDEPGNAPQNVNLTTQPKRVRTKGKAVKTAKDVFAAADLLLEAVCKLASTTETAGEIRSLTAALKDIKEIQMIRDAVSGTALKIDVGIEVEDGKESDDQADGEP